MRFTDDHLDALCGELQKLADLPAEHRVSLTFPLAKQPDEYAKRPGLRLGENRHIHCQDNSGQFTPHRYRLLQHLITSPTGVIHVTDLCGFDETSPLAPLWKGKIPEEGSLRNLASRINGDLATYGMPWFVSYSHVHHCFILRFLPDPQTERKKYLLRLPWTCFFQNSTPSRTTVFPVVRSSDRPVLLNHPPCDPMALE
jgi:hypothetical protein